MDLNEDDYSSEARENESEESEEEVQEIESTLIAKPKTKSAVWNFFRVESDSDGHPSNTNKPICCKCLEPVAASYGNTSNLFNHFRLKHPLVYAIEFMTRNLRETARVRLQKESISKLSSIHSVCPRNMTERGRNGSN